MMNEMHALTAVSSRHDLLPIEGPRVAALREVYGGGPPILLDLKVYDLLLEQGLESAAAISRSRIRFTGTDGLRGRVSPGPAEGLLAGLQAYVRTNAVTPALVRLCGLAFAYLLRQAAGVTGPVAVAEDGRDGYKDGLLFPALKDGLADGGMPVTDIGIAPTPGLVTAMQQFELAAGMMLTASHNPSNQNGVKFFCRGRKLLPEGAIGEYSLAAVMYALSWNSHLVDGPEAAPITDRSEDARERFLEFMAGHFPEGIKARLLIDAANGAFSHLCDPLMDRIGRGQWEIINNQPDGSNINASCGVASVEGRDRFEGRAAPEEFDRFPATVKSLFTYGRENGDTVGISVDGDGDRGFLLLYRSARDVIEVVNGDRAGYALAGLTARGESERRLFAGTVESDIRLFQAVRRDFDLEVEIHCVGDKWLLAGDRYDRLLTGQEVSGHLLVPAYAEGSDGGRGLVLCGNGLLAMLQLAAEYGMEIPVFENGHVRTFYTYNVNKKLFGRDLAVWDSDRAIIREAFAAAEGMFDPDGAFSFREHEEEPDMLYAGVFDKAGGPEAVVFVRVSGTENKIGTYIRGEIKHAGFLDDVAARINANHRSIKDADSPMTRAEKRIMEARTQGDALTEKEICQQFPLSAEDYQALLTGMRREGLL